MLKNFQDTYNTRFSFTTKTDIVLPKVDFFTLFETKKGIEL